MNIICAMELLTDFARNCVCALENGKGEKCISRISFMVRPTFLEFAASVMNLANIKYLQ